MVKKLLIVTALAIGLYSCSQISGQQPDCQSKIDRANKYLVVVANTLDTSYRFQINKEFDKSFEYSQKTLDKMIILRSLYFELLREKCLNELEQKTAREAIKKISKHIMTLEEDIKLYNAHRKLSANGRRNEHND